MILDLMKQQGYLNDKQYAEAKANPAVLSKAAQARAGGYFADWVMDSGPGFLTSETTDDITIKTTFDQDIQRAAERALKRIFDEKLGGNSKAEAAVVVMSETPKGSRGICPVAAWWLLGGCLVAARLVAAWWPLGGRSVGGRSVAAR